MSSIDAVIAAARRPGGFAARNTFSLARSRAIEKMRKFALADPHMYVLEVVQSAVASGAVSIDVTVDGDTVTVGWVGTGHVTPDELGQLFDFLFASKDRVDLAHVRTLAVGVNAALSFGPDRIVVESGSPITGEAARFEVKGRRDAVETVDVGTSDRRFSGTYVRVEGLGKGSHQWAGRGGVKERMLIERRCVELPVPIVFNGEAMFGFSSKRVPTLFGYGRFVSFDEGDLYGSIGIASREDEQQLRLMTHGVWIQSYTVPLLQGHAIGGIVNFDRLHKTVDHSGFVRDERFEEMRLRLMPYAHELVSGRKATPGIAKGVDGAVLHVGALRERLGHMARVVLVDDELRDAPGARARAATIADAVGGELLFAGAEAMRGVRALAAATCEVLVPDLSGDADVLFFTSAPAGAPFEGASFAPPVALAPTPTAELLAALAPGGEQQAELLARFVGVKEVGATVHAPRTSGPWDEGLWVRVLTFGRVLGTRLVPTAHAGFVLDVDLGHMSPADLRASLSASEDTPSLCDLVATLVADRAIPGLADLERKILSVVAVGDIVPGQATAHLLLAAVARTVVTQLRRGPTGEVTTELFVPRAPTDFDPLALPVVMSAAGRPLHLRAIAQNMDRCGGVVYGARPDVIAPDLAALDPALVLSLDAASEQAMIEIFGAPAYVRVDARECLAKAVGADGVELCVRDLACGARRGGGVEARPGLEVETRDGRAIEPAVLDDATFAALVEQLVACARRGAELERRPHVTDDDAELARQATLHLRRLALARVASGHMDASDPLRGLVLGWGIDDAPWTVGDLLARFHTASPPRLELFFDREIRPLWVDGETSSASLVMVDAQVARVLSRLGHETDAVGRFDFVTAVGGTPALGGAGVGTGAGTFAWIVHTEIDAKGVTGTVGITAGAEPAGAGGTLLVFTHDGELVGPMPTLARRLGLSGVLRVGAGVPEVEQTLERGLEHAADDLWPQLVDRLSSLEGAQLDGVVRRMLSHLEVHLQLVSTPRGEIMARFTRPTAELVASRAIIPLVEGAPISPRRLIDRWSQLMRRGDGTADVVEALGVVPRGPAAGFARASLAQWRVFHPPSQVAEEPGASGAADGDGDGTRPWRAGPLSADVLAANLTHWLDVLRPDTHPAGRRVYCQMVGADGDANDPLDTVEVFGTRIQLDLHHPLVRDALGGESGPTPVQLARLLAACYGRLNAVHHEITNDHELTFLRRLADALRDDELRALEDEGLRSPPVVVVQDSLVSAVRW